MEALNHKQADELFISWKNRTIDFMQAYQEQNVAAMLENCSAECQVAFLPLGEDGNGLAQETGKAIWTALIDCFPNIDNTVHSVTNENGAVKCEVTIWGKQVKDFSGLKSKGNTFEEDHIFIFEMDESGYIQSIAVNWDHKSFVAQLSR